jgi:hypothetical protein
LTVSGGGLRLVSDGGSHRVAAVSRENKNNDGK